MRRIGVLAGLVSTVLVAGLIGCSSKSPSSQPSQPSQVSGKVVVFAAASLKPAFTHISQQFKAENASSSVDFEFAGSSELATQLAQGATADVFAAPKHEYTRALFDAAPGRDVEFGRFETA